jgi:hypothetical protein
MASDDGVIVSSLPGRLRLRHAVLRQPAVNAALSAEIAGWAGVTAATGNAATGGLLVLYDAGGVSRAIVESRAKGRVLSHVAGAAEQDADDEPTDLWEAIGAFNRPAKIGMLATLGASLMALTVSRRAHAAFGGAYLGLLAVHLLKHRRKLVR